MNDAPRITANELAERLAGAKKVMKKVDTGDYEKGNVNTDVINKSPEELMEINVPGSPASKMVIGTPTKEKIIGSRLPDAIKRAMIEHPIPVPDISLSDGLDAKLVNKAKKLMEEDNGSNKKGTTSKQSKQPIQIRENIDIPALNNLEMIIENVIRRVLDEKLTQILNAQGGQHLNENLVIKVGDSLFSGKITKVKSTK